jgi:hypothetical protein
VVLAIVGSWPVTAGAQAQPEPGPSNANATFEFSPRGYVQLDWRGYPGWDVPTGSGRLNHEPLEVRRARVGFDGQWRRLSFELTVDPQDADGVLVKDAYGQFRISRALRIRAGQFKLPGGREYGTSARSIDFMERSALSESIAAGRDIGVMATGEIGRRFDYAAGVFAGDGNGREARADWTGAGRVVWALSGDLDVAASFSGGRTSSVDTDPPTGLEGRAPSGYRFVERVYVQGLRARTGADVAWNRGPWTVAGEVLRAYDQRSEQGLDFEDLPGAVGLGWSASVTREFGRRSRGPRARWREFDLAVRLDQSSFDDTGPSTARDSVRTRATDIRARGAATLTTGLSWRPTNWVRVLTNASAERYSERRSAPEAGKRGYYLVIGTRLQVELP